MSAEKQVAKMNTSVPSTQAEDQSWVDDSEILSTDFIIPRILLMQGLSDLVNERKAAQGDIIRSTTGEILGSPVKPVKFIPIRWLNTWIKLEYVGKQTKPEYRGQVERNAKNEHLPWEYEENGTKWKRVKCINMYVLLQADLEKDPVTAFPAIISFRSTSFRAAQAMLDKFLEAKAHGQPPASATFELSCKQEKNDLGSFYVFTTQYAGPTKQSHLEAARGWFQRLKGSQFKEDESEFKGKETKSVDVDEDTPF